MRQSNLLLHFLRMAKFEVRSFGVEECLSRKFNSPLFNIFMLFTFVTSLFYYIISAYVNFYLHLA